MTLTRNSKTATLTFITAVERDTTATRETGTVARATGATESTETTGATGVIDHLETVTAAAGVMATGIGSLSGPSEGRKIINAKRIATAR